MTEEDYKGDTLPAPVVNLYPEGNILLRWQEKTKIGAGLVNLRNTCFLNSVIQSLTYTAPLANFFLQDDHLATCKQTGFCILCEIQKHIKQCFENSGSAIRPKNIVNNLELIADHMRRGRQEDAHEFLIYVLDAMKRSAAYGYEGLDRYSMETTIVGRIFGGFLKSQVKCLQCSGVSCRYEAFHEISLEIKDVKTVVQAFKKYTTPETLSGDNAYMCETCNRKTTAQKGYTIEKPPNVLVVSLQRFDCFSSRKIAHHVQFQEEIDVRPFFSSSEGDRLPYQLYAVIVHAGTSSNCGHYYAYVKSPLGEWHCMDDAKVRQVHVSKVLSAQAYLLFYQKCASEKTTKDTTKTEELKTLEHDFIKQLQIKDKTISEKDNEIKGLTVKNILQQQQWEMTLKNLQSQVVEKDKTNSDLKHQVERMKADLKLSKKARKHQGREFVNRLKEEKDQHEKEKNKTLKDLEEEYLERDEKNSKTITELQNTLLQLQEENKRIKDECDKKLHEHVTKLEEEKDQMREQLSRATEKNKTLKDLEEEYLERDEKNSKTITELQNTLLQLQEENKRIKDECDKKLHEHVTKLEEEKDQMREQLSRATEKQHLAKKTTAKSLKSAISKFFKRFTGKKSSSKKKS